MRIVTGMEIVNLRPDRHVCCSCDHVNDGHADSDGMAIAGLEDRCESVCCPCDHFNDNAPIDA